MTRTQIDPAPTPSAIPAQAALPINPARLAGRTAVITGGSSGLGLATARQFLAEGARVVITGTNDEKLAHAVAALAGDGQGGALHAVRADARRIEDLEALAATVKDRFGTLDILVANAGIGGFAPIDGITPAAYDAQFDVNVKGVFFTVQALHGLMGPGGSIVLTASAVNAKGKAGGAVYFATKAAVRSLARSLADEFGPRGIRVNALSPGLVMTEFQARTGNSADEITGFGTYVTATAPLARLGEPDEIARAAAFLASDEAGYVTAADLVVDGGFMNV